MAKLRQTAFALFDFDIEEGTEAEVHNAYADDNGNQTAELGAIRETVRLWLPKASWRDLGFTSAKSKQWRKAGVKSPDKAFALGLRGVSPADVRVVFREECLGDAYEDGTYTADQVLAVLEAAGG